jgi:hypothetical protein
MRYAPRWLRGGREQQYGYLHCVRTQQRGRTVVRPYPPCPTPHLDTRALWPRVRDLLLDAVRDPDRIVSEVKVRVLADAAHEARSALDDAAELERLTDGLAELDALTDTLYHDLRIARPPRLSEADYDRQKAKLDAERRALEEAKRRLLDHRTVIERAEQGTAVLRTALEDTRGLPLEQFTLAEWTAVFDALVSDVLLDHRGEPSLRWQQAARPVSLPRRAT